MVSCHCLRSVCVIGFGMESNLYGFSGLGSLILTQAFDAFHTAGQGGEIAEEILSLLAIDEELWDSGGSRLLATENNHWNWSLEKRLLLLQFPQVLPHLPSLTHQTHH